MNVTYRYMPPGNYTSLSWVADADMSPPPTDAPDPRVTTIIVRRM